MQCGEAQGGRRIIPDNEEDNEEKDWGFGVALTNDSVVLA
jgi:hypothetical protein